MQSFFRTERYMRLATLNRVGDMVGVRRLIELAVAETEGRERAFWLLVRAGGMTNLPAPPVPAIMADTRAALELVPGDPGTEEAALLNLLGLVVRAERWEEGPRWVAMLRRVMKGASEPFMLWFNLGTLQWRRARPRAAVRNFSRALSGMYAWGEERRAANQLRYYTGHCYRAMAAAEAGMMELAERDVCLAEALLPSVPIAEDILLCLAHSSVALVAGDTAQSRRRLQWVRAQDQAGKYLRTAHPIRAEVEVQAARIALAEGNRQSFSHFTGRALAIAREHQLDLTARRVEALRARVLGESAAVEV